MKKFSGMLNAIAAIHLGLLSYGYNLLEKVSSMSGSPVLSAYIPYVFGISGVIYLVLMFGCLFGGCDAGSCASQSSCGCGMLGKK